MQDGKEKLHCIRFELEQTQEHVFLPSHDVFASSQPTVRRIDRCLASKASRRLRSHSQACQALQSSCCTQRAAAMTTCMRSGTSQCVAGSGITESP